jgi:hypothetical protein
MIDSFTSLEVFENIFIKNKKLLEKNATIKEIDSRYDYRPDTLAYEVYGQDFYYPAILIANNLGSIIQFKSSNMSNKCKIPSQDDINKLISIAKTQNNENKDN